MVTTWPLISLGRVQPGAGLPGDTSEMMIEYCLMGKRQTSRGCVAGKKCFVSLAEMTLASVTFSPASHHSLLFFILSGYTSASEIRDLLVLSSLWARWGSTFSPMPQQKCNLKFSSNTQGHGHYRKVPKKHLLTCTTQHEAELTTSKLKVSFQKPLKSFLIKICIYWYVLGDMQPDWSWMKECSSGSSEVESGDTC